VRNLAQRCAQAAKDTSALIEESIAKSSEGKTKVDYVSQAMRAITEESAKVKTLVDEVNVGSQEQTRGIEQISNAITQMEQVTQKTAANAEESAAAAEELNAQSETLKDVTERLGKMVGVTETVAGRVRGGGRREAGAPANMSRRPAGGHSSLLALRNAVKSDRPEPGVSSRGIRGPAKGSFPLDEQFKEF
jgi:methyl-accepting chemotaxis protein/methyl-accepting chemotaxis protein-1 (serine sensor receptor)